MKGTPSILWIKKSKAPCRSIFGNCDHSLETCINFSEEPNSPYHRGNARQITKEEAISLVETCNQDGLIHTLEGNHGLCNCCGDCCFEYRSAIMCDTIGIWPITNTIASWNKSACINCGICVKRCPMKAFTKTQNDIFLMKNVVSDVVYVPISVQKLQSF